MKLSPVIAELRRRCPTFSKRVYGAAEFAAIDASTVMQMPCAYVLPLGESAEPFQLNTNYRQWVEQSFGVVVYVTTGANETGLEAYDNAEEIKLEVLKAIAGWCPTDDVNEVIYEGTSILDLSRARLAVQLEFNVSYDIVDSETRHGVDLSELPDLQGVNIDLTSADGDVKASVSLSMEK